MSAFSGSFFKASLSLAGSLAGLLAVASFGACNNGNIPIGNDQQPISCTTTTDCPNGQGCASDHVCATVCATDSDCPSGDVCSAGLCLSTTQCTLTTCGTACVDTQTDANNCGACGDACPSGESCVAGACTAPAACTTDAECPSGDVCTNGACVPETTCALTTCGTQCVDTQTDAANCGACGVACASGEELRRRRLHHDRVRGRQRLPQRPGVPERGLRAGILGVHHRRGLRRGHGVRGRGLPGVGAVHADDLRHPVRGPHDRQQQLRRLRRRVPLRARAAWPAPARRPGAPATATARAARPAPPACARAPRPPAIRCPTAAARPASPAPSRSPTSPWRTSAAARPTPPRPTPRAAPPRSARPTPSACSPAPTPASAARSAI